MKRLVVVGGNAAGLSAASYVKRRMPHVEVLVFERTNHASYASCGLPYLIEGIAGDPLNLIALPVKALREKRGIDIRLRHEVAGIDTKRRTVTVKNLGDSGVCDYSYDRLVISTGASPVKLSVPGIDLDGVFTLRSLDDGIRLKSFIESRSPKRVVVVGGGYVGLEMAEAFSVRSLDVTLVEKMDRVLGNFDPEIATPVQDKLREKGVSLLLGSGLRAIEKAGEELSVVTEEGFIPCDLVLIGVGVKPDVSLAAAAGIELGQTGAIWVNDRMETSEEHVYACGDCAEAYHRLIRRNTWIPLGDTANKQGRVAGANIAGEDVSFPGIIGTAATKVFDLELARTGLGEEEAVREGFSVYTTFVESSTRAHYYPGRKDISIKLIVERGTKRLLGAQAVGGEAVAKRIDVFATAIWAGMTADELAWVDLTYVPPVAPVWDPILLAAQVGMKEN
ncbi:MAG: FAD-dependent oxidoreductase [Candidatus Methanosuratincola sp.]